MGDQTPGVLLLVKFKSTLPTEELQRRYKERMPEFRALPGLMHKYYAHDRKNDEWAGIYLWDSQQSLEAYLVSDLRKSIPTVYRVEGEPRVEVMDIVDTLRG